MRESGMYTFMYLYNIHKKYYIIIKNIILFQFIDLIL
jgi:hypothetical protein